MKKLLLAGTTVLLMATGTTYAAEKTPDELQQEENHIFSIDGVQQKTFHKLIASGMNARIAIFGFVNPDCTAKEHAVRITKEPEHGKVTVSPTKEFLTYKGNAAKCSQHKTQTTEIKYKSEDKYTGKDEVGALVLWEGGYAWEVQITLDVR